MERVIVKVQLPLVGTPGAYGYCMIYDKERGIMEELPIPKGLYRQMWLGQGKFHMGKKQFFYARIEGHQVVLEEVAPWQDW